MNDKTHVYYPGGPATWVITVCNMCGQRVIPGMVHSCPGPTPSSQADSARVLEMRVFDSESAFDCLMEEATEANEFLDTLGDIAAGDKLKERIVSVVKHYAAQVGRWGAK